MNKTIKYNVQKCTTLPAITRKTIMYNVQEQCSPGALVKIRLDSFSQ